MAENLNYRINLVIEPKNVIRANRELRAMERYFERIQGRVLKIGRTRMMPEVVLKDNASKGLDQILNKLNRVRSQIINASGSVSVMVQQKTSAATSNAPTTIEGLAELKNALLANTAAVMANTLSRGASGGGDAGSGGLYDKVKNHIKDGLDLFKAITGEDFSIKWLRDKMKGKKGQENEAGSGGESGDGAGGDSGGGSGSGPSDGAADRAANGNDKLLRVVKDIKGLMHGVIQELKKKQDIIVNCCGGSGGKRQNRGRRSTGGTRRRNSQGRGFTENGRDIANQNSQNRRNGQAGGQNGRNNPAGSGNGGSNGDDSGPRRRGGSSRAGSGRGGRKGGRGGAALGALSFMSGGMPGLPDMSSMFGGLTDKLSGSGSGVLSKLGSGLNVGKKFLGGPLGMMMDAASIASAKPGKERAQAVGSTVGGIAGGAIGGAIGSFILPGAGTAAGAYVGSLVGDVVGGKVGGWIADNGPMIKKKVSEVTGWLSDKTSDIGKGISNFFSWGKKEEPVKKETPAQPTVPPKPVVSPAVASVAYPAVSPVNRAAMPVSPFVGPPIPFNPAATVNPMLSAAAASQASVGAVKGKGTQTPQAVQISPEQMTTLGTYLKDFKTETTNQVSVNFPVGAVQMTVHENTLDIGAIVAQVAARLDAELRKANQNRKPAVV